MSDDEGVEWEYEGDDDAMGRADSDEQQAQAEAEAEDDDGEEEAFEYSDVEWEDASTDECDPEPMTESDAARPTTMDLGAVDWEHVNRALQREADAARPPKKRKIARMTHEDKAHELARHKSHLLVLMAAQWRRNAVAGSRLLQGLMLSLTADLQHGGVERRSVASPEMPRAFALEALVRWFHGHFRLDDGAHSANDILTEERLMRVFFARVGRPEELAVLFTILCRALGLRCRHCVALDPLVVQHPTNAAEAATTGGSGAGVPSARRKRGQSAHPSPADGDLMASNASVAAWTWCEVLDESHSRWIPVDGVRKLIDRPLALAELRGKGAPVSYAVGIDESGWITDVSARYVDRWSKCMPLRLADGWLEHALEQINRSLAPEAELAPTATEQRLRATEREQLRAMTASEAMPTSLEGFKRHHLYCLERHLGRFECLHPRKAVGLFNGLPVFLRRDIQLTRTTFQWRRLGRQVRPEELPQPAKRLADCKDNESLFSSSSSPLPSRMALYGQWQTSEVVVPPVENGRVPKNQYGNIELWSPQHLPRGAVHVRLPRIAKVAEELGLDFAPAVVGFEARNGRNHPKIDGIVVAESAEATLLDAHAHLQQQTIERAIAKNARIIARRWERLVRRALLKLRLDEEYGAV